MPAPDTHSNPLKRQIPGAALIAVGSVLALSGGGVLAAFGTDGTAGSGRHHVSTPANAIVTPVTAIRHMSDVSSVIGKTTLRVSARDTAGGRPVFMGVARAADVDRYLHGASTAEISDIGPWRFHVDAAQGAGRARVARPASQRFWVARANPGSTLRWHVRDGRYRVVVMSADGRRGVTTKASVALGATNLAWMSIAVFVIGATALAGGIALVVRTPGGTRRPKPTTVPSATIPA